MGELRVRGAHPGTTSLRVQVRGAACEARPATHTTDVQAFRRVRIARRARALVPVAGVVPRPCASATCTCVNSGDAGAVPSFRGTHWERQRRVWPAPRPESFCSNGLLKTCDTWWDDRLTALTWKAGRCSQRMNSLLNLK
jgi:hypothetical protein